MSVTKLFGLSIGMILLGAAALTALQPSRSIVSDAHRSEWQPLSFSADTTTQAIAASKPATVHTARAERSDDRQQQIQQELVIAAPTPVPQRSVADAGVQLTSASSGSDQETSADAWLLLGNPLTGQEPAHIAQAPDSGATPEDELLLDEDTSTQEEVLPPPPNTKTSPDGQGPAGLFAPPPPVDSRTLDETNAQPPASAGEDDLLDHEPTDDNLLSPSDSHEAFPVPPVPAGKQPGSPPSSAREPAEANGEGKKPGEGQTEVDPHADLYSKKMYPSAQDCRECHEQIYEEWASSSHAYAAISPMFHKFEQTITDLSKGTVGYFCQRCHSPVGTSIGYPRHESIWDAIPAAREGVTCITCHRVRFNYTKADGERRIEPGTVYDPVYGAGYGETLAQVLQKKDHYKVKTSEEEKGPGQPIHTGVIHFEQIKTSHICSACHQVAVEPGIKLEVVWEQYRASPACKMGIQCQDCHMGIEPGLPVGYDVGPVAVVGGKKIDPQRKHSNHLFYGPGYSIAHPGLFPFNPKAQDWEPEEWLLFDYRAGWGTKEYEKLVENKQLQVDFPEAWNTADDRMDAREIVDANLKKLVAKMRMRRRLMENTSRIEGPVFANPPALGQDLRISYLVRNLNNGHNMPSGSLGAQPQIWLNVVLTGPRGNRLWESGYVDRNGDMADLHSLEVAAGRITRDQQLFNLQTKFLITHVKGPDREMYLPINTDIDQLPFLRPSPFPVKVLNHPPFIRMEGHSLAPLGTREANYRIPAQLLAEPGRYRLSVRMRSRAEPIYFMRFCGATPEMERTMNEWMLDFHDCSSDFWVR